MEEGKKKDFDYQLHLNFLLNCYNKLPGPYESQDSNRLTLAYFIIGGIDVLGAIDRINKKDAIDFVYSLQILPDISDKNWKCCGFRGSHFRGEHYDPSCTTIHSYTYDFSHIAMTYVALALLKMLGDDFSRINKKAILRAMKNLQQADGSYSPVADGSENDVRFIYCAAAISTFLNDWSGIDVDKAVNYILSCQSYDRALSQGPGQESHGGPTYCGLATLVLTNRLEYLPHKDALIKWCIERQVTGFQGRINKIVDTCYSFWIGGSLELLNAYRFVDTKMVRSFSISCQHQIGGFSKWPDIFPDVLHTYFGLCGLSLTGEPGLLPIDCRLGVTKRAISS